MSDQMTTMPMCITSTHTHSKISTNMVACAQYGKMHAPPFGDPQTRRGALHHETDSDITDNPDTED
jgi:hypothetical protein